MDIPLLLLDIISVEPFSVYSLITLIIIMVLLGISAFVSSSEVAFFSLTPQHQSEMETANTEADQRVFALQQQSDYLLATILITNNFVNVAIVVLTAYLIDSTFKFVPWLEFLVQTVIITFLLLLFGEIMPKVYAQQNPVKAARRASGTFVVLTKICRPFAMLLVKPTKSLNHLTRQRHDNLSIDELNEAIDLTASEELDDEKEILKGIVNFGSTSVDAVMTMRLDMVTIDSDTPFTQVLKIVEKYGY